MLHFRNLYSKMFSWIGGEDLEFKDKIRYLRKKENMTMDDLAAKVGVSTPTIQRYESGEIKNIRRDKIKLLADALNVTPGYLMGWPSDTSLNNIAASIHSTLHDENLKILLEKCNKMNAASIKRLIRYADLLIEEQESAE